MKVSVIALGMQGRGEIEAAPLTCDSGTTGCAGPLASLSISDGLSSDSSHEIRLFTALFRKLSVHSNLRDSSEQGDRTHDEVARRFVEFSTSQSRLVDAEAIARNVYGVCGRWKARDTPVGVAATPQDEKTRESPLPPFQSPMHR
jgi:hypothetical protein